METETFWTLFTDLAHWEFELFLILLFDVLVGLLLWPWIRKFILHHKSDDERIAELERKVEEISR
ncbi:MAG: hypothetical protein UY47_C0004G0011 [Parcubacteria group bacterium GW2011_GWB1_49_7]|uniref:Uncharacterized protein n=1 Tax=Candidatus Zambryskibacteria bacterium RIFCSPHIGHO2_01_FULL_46_25 TaxID=1802738 RepID=A0A1G2SZZ1_9BACT|nr:MAG: hypothetical protein UX71_C0002G0101 [Parcubacteria group bacterium GW2011_GWA1_47_10]KKW09837.1 MAG: hypothetical protein UY47_C0004G0011 [Parcubacteria group bacterium GW2011_GWB1_49_7]OHA90616.1 MAG: hypothetical protein A2838_02760 [Candidatus Zambryskibacteria bacterium RIFCSPHIGHO2_01_FULL_46_25]OHB01793.1 MAG: hypothetical protein A3F53_00615 [Candidatus Zambryskibacteria bacterium RIFCSPHIGHO2_12_FULL_48_10]OHB07259.1 MAG: hypothetical protein A3A31_01900 [Candidatus Zambryskiba